MAIIAVKHPPALLRGLVAADTASVLLCLGGLAVGVHIHPPEISMRKNKRGELLNKKGMVAASDKEHYISMIAKRSIR